MARFQDRTGVEKLDLETIVSALTGLGQVRLRPEKCIRSISPRSTCRRCLEVCPVEGIEFKDNRPSLRECLRCGLCSVVCPGGALEDPERTHLFILNRGRELLSGMGRVVFACTGAGEDILPDNFLLLPCLGAVAPEVIVTLAVMGEVVFYHRPEACAHCRFGGEELFLSSFAWARQTLAALDVPPANLVKTAVVKQELNIKKQVGHREITGMGRRDLFRSLARGVMMPINKLTGSVPAQVRNAADRTCTKEAILCQALKRIRPVTGFPTTAKLPLASLKLARSCYLCNICSRLCPAGALALTDDQLTYVPARCRHCGLCLAVCSVHSLTWGENLSLEVIAAEVTFTLAVAEEHFCSTCGEAFRAGAGADRCLRCCLTGTDGAERATS